MRGLILKSKAENAFENWLELRLSKATSYAENSPMDTIIRYKQSKLSSIKFELKELVKDIKRLSNEFDGFNTNVGWFVELLFIPFVLSVGVPVRCKLRYNRAVNDFRVEYDMALNGLSERDYLYGGKLHSYETLKSMGLSDSEIINLQVIMYD